MTTTNSIAILAASPLTEVSRRAAETLRDEIARRSNVYGRILKSNDVNTVTEEFLVILAAKTEDTLVRSFISQLGIREPSGGEAYCVFSGEISSRRLVVLYAASEQALFPAAGAFLRSIEYEQGEIQIPDLKIYFSPYQKIRGCLLSNHYQTNSYDRWELSDWEDYIKEMALWGNNILITTAMHAMRWPWVEPWKDAPVYQDDHYRKEWHRQWGIQRALPLICKRYGLKYGVWNPVNDVFPLTRIREQEKDPLFTRREGGWKWDAAANQVCPSHSGARKTINDIRERLFEGMPNIDVLFLPSGDNGGCWCEKCVPWANTYVSLVKEHAAILHRYHPNAKVWVSNQSIDMEETNIIINFIKDEKPDYLEGFVFGPYSGTTHTSHAGAGFEQLRNLLEGTGVDVVHYPDTTHMFRCQYPIDGLDPELKRVAGREDLAFSRPNGFKAVHERTYKNCVGSVQYSEGCHDNMNAVMWNQFDLNPAIEVQAAAAEYCSWYFGAESVKDMVPAFMQLEENFKIPLAHNDGINKAIELIEAAWHKMNNAYKTFNWRFEMVRMEAYMLKYIKEMINSIMDPAGMAALRAEILKMHVNLMEDCRLDIRSVERMDEPLGSASVY